MITYYKGFIGKEDIEFGTDTFLRKDKNHSSVSLTKVNASYIPRKVITKTADFTITSEIGGITYVNTGAAGTVVITLPTAISGKGIFSFIVSAAQILRVDPNGSEYFRDCAAGKYKGSDSQGNILNVWCDVTGIWEWNYDLVTGNWDNET